MKKSMQLLLLTATLCASSCGGTVPGPKEPDKVKEAKCTQLSLDKSLGCAACAGYSFCAWKQTAADDPTSGTCHFVKDVTSLPEGLIADPTHCPKPE